MLLAADEKAVSGRNRGGDYTLAHRILAEKLEPAFDPGREDDAVLARRIKDSVRDERRGIVAAARPWQGLFPDRFASCGIQADHAAAVPQEVDSPLVCDRRAAKDSEVIPLPRAVRRGDIAAAPKPYPVNPPLAGTIVAPNRHDCDSLDYHRCGDRRPKSGPCGI